VMVLSINLFGSSAVMLFGCSGDFLSVFWFISFCFK
jgi:hypothetical protein